MDIKQPILKQNLISKELISGGLLLFGAILALIINNSNLSGYYNQFLDTKLAITINDFGLDKRLLLWINDGLMAMFFLLVGLELKREILVGELSDPKKVILPIFGALGGMIVPILIYFIFNYENSNTDVGWAIPMATDIAFALGAMALLGKRVPIELKLFLLTLAIIDDLGAIVIIGLFYAHDISLDAIYYSVFILIILSMLNLYNISRVSVYLMFGLLLWFCTLQSGFHATIAGVILALFIPLESRDGKKVLATLEEDIKPLVSFVILPLFAFANSGIPFDTLSLSDFYHPLSLGIIFGLVLGKMLGIFSFTIVAQKIVKTTLPYSYYSLLGTSLLCGIGFTMSLFISSLSFYNDAFLLNLSRLGIMVGSVISMVFGLIILHFSLKKVSNNNSDNNSGVV